MRSILLHVENDASLDVPLQAALSLARATNGHITCLHAIPIEAYVAFDNFGGVFVMPEVIEALDEQAARLQSRVKERLGKEDVSWEYIKSNGSVPQAKISHAALADVVVTGRAQVGEKPDRSALGRLGDLVLKSRSPILIPAIDGADFNPLGKAMIAWNGSYEAANAVRGSLSLLKLAASIELVRVEGEDDALFPSTRLLEYLSRHDIHADLRIETLEKDFVAETLIARALHTDASHIVLGGYGHTRIGEYIFGGVTRSMLASSPVNLVIAH
jgi:nucleotide-binding universal stress UspA family protein